MLNFKIVCCRPACHTFVIILDFPIISIVPKRSPVVIVLRLVYGFYRTDRAGKLADKSGEAFKPQSV